MAVRQVDRAKALLESRAAQRRYRRLARQHYDAGKAALARYELGEAGRHFIAADHLGHLALAEKLREPKA